MRFTILDSRQKAEAFFEEGVLKRILIEKEEICVVRKGADYFAFSNACPHLGEKLHNGTINHLNEIVCPLHAYRFHIQSGDEANRRCKALKTYPVLLTEYGLFIDC